MAAVWKFADDNSFGYYRRPLNIPIELAASFGEVRENHFHMGLDIRTDGRENLPVYAVADGFVSRVSVEESGYGNAMYITHPNGITTVYGHLNHFMDGVETYVRQKQYRDKCWQQDIRFTPGMFAVKKGDIIGLSGNTGNTEGPHLHFEMRDTKTGFNINPLLNGIVIPDNIAPAIHALYWYDASRSIYTTVANKINIKEGNNGYTTSANVTVVNSQYISFGISAVDKNTISKYHLGIYKMQLYVDGIPQFSFSIDRFNGSDVRYVNACIDYSSWVQYSRCIQLLRILPGNHLPVFSNSPGSGIIHLKDKKNHHFKITVSDAAGNTSAVQGMIQFNGAAQMPVRYKNNTRLLLPGKAAHFVTQNAVIDFTNRAVYDTLPLAVTEEMGDDYNAASRAVFLHDATVPVHDSIKIQLKTNLPSKSSLRKHVVILLTNEKHSIPIKGTWMGDYMFGYCMEFGRVQLVIDTVSPVISMQEGNDHSFKDSDKGLHISYHDNMGEAYFFRAELDGHWIMFEKKGNLFTYNFDEHCRTGKHNLMVMAGDRAGNITQRVFTFTYL